MLKNNDQAIGKIIFISGIALVLLGIIITFKHKIPFLKNLGHLPGDVLFKKNNFTFYFSFVTCIILSIVFSFLFWLFSKK